MVKAVEYAVRRAAGGVVRGSVAGPDGSAFLQVGSGEAVSLNLAPGHVTGYFRTGGNLVVRLIDGREIVLAGFFEAAPGQANTLYLSSDGQIVRVGLTDGGGGTLLASYGPSEGWTKFSALDDLRFDRGETLAMAPGAGDDPAGMAPFLPGLLGLGGSGLLPAAVIGGGAAVIGGGGGGRKPLTVDQPDASHTVTTNTPNPQLVVSGTGQPGDSVTVTIGNQTQTTTIGNGGTWSVTFPSTGLPPDGTYEAVVTGTRPGGGTPVTLDGPTFIIDLTPPAVAITEGTESRGHVENAAAHADGVTIRGTGEVGADISVSAGGHTRTTTVAADGTWSVTFTAAQLPGGDYATGVTVTATDALGNRTTITDRLVIDTLPHPLAINPVTADNTVSGAEWEGGARITGTSAPGATVSLTIAGETRSVTVAADGTWSIDLGSFPLGPGEYQATVTATTTDAAGNTSSASRSFSVDTQTFVSLTAPVAGDDVVNAAEAAAGVTLTGNAQPGASVSVAWNGTTLPATVNAQGAWSVTFPRAAIPAGEYASTVTVTATDAAGNSASRSHAVRVDTATGVSVDAGQAGGDNIVSGAERAGGLILTGRAEAGASVAVTFEGATRTVTATQSGTWSAAFAAAEIPAGTRNATVSVTATDAAGNSATTTHALAIDTEVTDFRRLSLATGADAVLNAAEAAGGLTVTGTVEPGSTVSLRFGSGPVRAATVAADGTWTVTFPPADIPAGQNDVTLTATATDGVGNTATISETVRVDTLVAPFTRDGGTIGGDGVLNAAEVRAGLPLFGTAEAGATVEVRLSSGAVRSVVAGADGTWSVTFPAADLPTGERQVTATIRATDVAGNTATLTETFAVDTVAPGSPEVVSFSRDANGLRGIGTETTGDSYAFTSIDGAGNQMVINTTRSEDPAFGETSFRFAQSVPDGSYLVINATDAAGNQSSTLLVVDNTNAPTVNLGRAGLANFDFAAIDLTFAPDARMTITEAQLTDLTGPDNRLMVKGGADDTVTAAGAVATGATQMIDGQRYAVYTLGTAGATLLLDEDIRVVT